MAIPETRGLKYTDQLKLGIDELGWLQGEYERLRGRRDHWLHTGSRGLLIPRLPSGVLSTTWKVVGDVATGKLRIDTSKPGLPHFPAQVPPLEADLVAGAIDPDGYYFEHVEDFGALADPWLLQVPDDNTWYTLVVRRVRTSRQKGYLNVTVGSTTVTGVGTEFTRLLAYTDDALDSPRGTLIRIPDDLEVPRALGRGGSALANEGVYEVDEIVSDTELRLRAPVNGTTESGLHWFVRGDFQGAPPADPAADVLKYDRAEFELVARTIESAGDYVIADVKYDSGGSNPALQVIDRRMANLYRRPLEQPMGMPILMQHARNQQSNGVGSVSPVLNNDFDPDTPTLFTRITSLFGTELQTMDIAPAAQGVLAIVQSDTEVRCYQYRVQDGDVYFWASLSTPDATGNAFTVAFCQVPQPDFGGSATAPTHLLFYTKSGIVYMRSTPDNGTTWSGESVIWNPTLVDALDFARELSVKLLQCGRIILMATYDDNSVGDRDIRYIYSDDLGGTWNNNGDEGYKWASDAGIDFRWPSIFQDDSGRIHTAFISSRDTGATPKWSVVYEPSTSTTTLAREGAGTVPLGCEIAYEGTARTSIAEPSLAVWADPMGNAVVLVDERPDANNRLLRSYTFGYGLEGPNGDPVLQCLDSRPFLYTDDAGGYTGSANDVWCSPRILEIGGQLNLGFISPASAGNAQGTSWMLPIFAAHTPAQLSYWFRTAPVVT